MWISDEKHPVHIYAIRSCEWVEPYVASLSDLRPDISQGRNAMDDLTLASHLRMLRQEISEIAALNQEYCADTQPCMFDTEMHNKRRQRLEQIKEELVALQMPVSRAS